MDYLVVQNCSDNFDEHRAEVVGGGLRTASFDQQGWLNVVHHLLYQAQTGPPNKQTVVCTNTGHYNTSDTHINRFTFYYHLFWEKRD